MITGEPPRTVQIPGSDQHAGHRLITVTLAWVCPDCGGPRGHVTRTTSYDGSRQLGCDGWTNPCGHVDLYSNVRREAKAFQAARRGQAPLAEPAHPGITR